MIVGGEKEAGCNKGRCAVTVSQWKSKPVLQGPPSDVMTVRISRAIDALGGGEFLILKGFKQNQEEHLKGVTDT